MASEVHYPAAGAKPVEIERACARGKNGNARPLLAEPFVQDGFICATDSYVAARVPLADDVPAGTITAAAVKAWRKANVPAEVDDRFVRFATKDGEQRAFERPVLGELPRLSLLIPTELDTTPRAGTRRISFGINAEKLLQAALAIGATEVRVTLQMPCDDAGRISRDARPLGKPFTVQPAGSAQRDGRIALVMPMSISD